MNQPEKDERRVMKATNGRLHFEGMIMDNGQSTCEYCNCIPASEAESTEFKQSHGGNNE